MPCTTSAGSGSGMQVASPPYSKARNRGVSSSQLASRLVVGRASGTAEKSGARKGFASWRAMTVWGTTRRVVRGRLGGGLGFRLRCGLAPGRPQQVVLEVDRGRRDVGALGEQLEQGGVAGRRLGQDGGDAVEPGQHRDPLGLRGGGVGLDPGALLAHQQGDHLVRRAPTGSDLAALGGGLDLPHGLGEDGDDALVVTGVRRAPVARRGTRRTGSARCSLCQADPSTQSDTAWSRRRGVHRTSRRRDCVADRTASRPPRTRARDLALAPVSLMRPRRSTGRTPIVRRPAPERMPGGELGAVARVRDGRSWGRALRDSDRQGSRSARPARRPRVRAPERLGCRFGAGSRAGRLPGHRHHERGHRLGLRGPGRRSRRPGLDARAHRADRGCRGRARDRRPRGRVRSDGRGGRPARWREPPTSARWAPTSRT